MNARFVVLISLMFCQILISFVSDTEVTFEFLVHYFDTESLMLEKE